MVDQQQVVLALPADAWLLQQQAAGQRVARVGPRVQLADGRLQEGSYGLGEQLASSSQVFGSAAIAVGRETLLVAPSHTLESLYVWRSKAGWAASNSLAMLLAGAELTLPFDRHYTARFASIVRGIHRYERRLCVWPDGSELLRIAYHNVQLRGDGSLRWLDKPLDPEFTDFAGYRDFAIATLRAAFQRAPWLLPTTACSSGYDSAGVTVLAAAAGCRQAFALSSSRSGDPDAGGAVAAALGLPMAELPRLAQVAEFADVADYLAAGGGGQDACYRHAEEWLQDRLLCTGFGPLWGGKGKPDTELQRSDLSGVCLQEVRLLRRFVQIPALMIAARHFPRLQALVAGADFAPYRLGGDYDKPIARRLLEEAGVPRGSFAQHKRAVSTLIFRDESLWTERAREQCVGWLPPDWQQAAQRWPVRFCDGWDRARYYLLRRLPRGRELVGRLFRDDRIHQHAGRANVLRFGAGLHRLVQHYRTLLA